MSLEVHSQRVSPGIDVNTRADLKRVISDLESLTKLTLSALGSRHLSPFGPGRLRGEKERLG